MDFANATIARLWRKTGTKGDGSAALSEVSMLYAIVARSASISWQMAQNLQALGEVATEALVVSRDQVVASGAERVELGDRVEVDRHGETARYVVTGVRRTSDGAVPGGFDHLELALKPTTEALP